LKYWNTIAKKFLLKSSAMDPDPYPRQKIITNFLRLAVKFEGCGLLLELKVLYGDLRGTT
jgi:hypothetical protein